MKVILKCLIAAADHILVNGKSVAHFHATVIFLVFNTEHSFKLKICFFFLNVKIKSMPKILPISLNVPACYCSIISDTNL